MFAANFLVNQFNNKIIDNVEKDSLKSCFNNSSMIQNNKGLYDKASVDEKYICSECGYIFENVQQADCFRKIYGVEVP